MVTDAAIFTEVYFRIDAVFKDKRVLIYNSAFDTKILNYCCQLHSLPSFRWTKRSDGLMEGVAQRAGTWNSYNKDYRYVRLNCEN